MSARFPLPEGGEELIALFELAIRRNHTKGAQIVYERILEASGKDIRGGTLNIGVAAIAKATEIALEVDKTTGVRRIDQPEWQEMWRCIPIDTSPKIEDYPRAEPSRGRPKTRDRLDARHKSMKAITHKIVGLKQLPKRGAHARREREGAAHSALQRQRAQLPRQALSAEQQAIMDILRKNPTVDEHGIRLELKRRNVVFTSRGFKDRVVRIRKQLKK